MNKVEQMKALVEELNRASNAYYNTGATEMTDYEFDQKLEQLKELESETSVIYANSPTINVGSKVLTELKEVVMDRPMLSLDKVHEAKEIKCFVSTHPAIAMVKCDGISMRIIYENGKFKSANSRGNGYISSDLTEHAKQFLNIPLAIDKNGTYIVDGEAVIKDSDFTFVNDKLLKQGKEKLKNSRNAASGSLSVLDTSIVKERRLSFICWDVIEGDDSDSLSEKLNNASQLGFEVVPRSPIMNNLITNDENKINKVNEKIMELAKENGILCDGVVWKFDSVAYGASKGKTEHHFCNAVAWKPNRNLVETTVRGIEWGMGKTGVLTPILLYDPVECDGTEISKASLHNISIMNDLELSYLDRIYVYKANLIIPQVDSNITKRRDNLIPIIDTCPICGGKTEIKKDNESEVLICTNPNCKGKLLGKLTHAVSRNALNIDGLSEATLETFIDRGWLTSIHDIYYLDSYKKEMTALPGFGAKSVNKLLKAIEDSKATTLERFLYCLSVPLLGKTASKTISKYCNDDIQKFINIMDSNIASFKKIDGIGDSLVDSMRLYWKENRNTFIELAKEFEFEKKAESVTGAAQMLSGESFAITGKLIHFANRDVLVAKIQACGGKYVSGVSKNTTYLINNDTTSTSGKNKKMHDLGKADHIISEEQFLEMIGE